MPPEVAEEEHDEALRFHKIFTELFKKIDESSPPKDNDLKSFTKDVVDKISHSLSTRRA